MNKEIILLIKYLISIYLLSFIFFIVVQKLHNRLYYSKNKNINRCSNRKFNNKNRKINDRLNKHNNKYSSKNKRLTKEERKRIERKYNLKAS